MIGWNCSTSRELLRCVCFFKQCNRVAKNHTVVCSCLSRKACIMKHHNSSQNQQHIKPVRNTIKTIGTYKEEEILECWKNKYLQKKKYFDAIFILGAMCSGKTRLINDEIRRHKIYKDFAYVDTDEIMELIEGFQPSKVDAFYPIAREISIKLTDWLLDERISFVAEGTCVKYVKLEDYMKRLKESGYRIRVKKVEQIPLHLVLSRANERKSRTVAEDVIKQIYVESEYGLKKLFDENKNINLFEEL